MQTNKINAKDVKQTKEKNKKEHEKGHNMACTLKTIFNM